MKLNNLTTLTLFTTIIMLACNKEASVRTNNVTTFQSNSASANICDDFKYADTIFYLQPSATDYIIKPVNKLTGTFGAFPTGLKINAASGNINATKSETGLKYIVWFVAAGATDTCKKFLTISGIDYTDSIYTLNTSSVMAKPIYNANRTQPIDCNGDCEFDNGLNSLTSQGIAIDKSTGKINLKKSISNGALGANPADGTFKDFLLEYKISDKSGKAQNRISFRLYYFKQKSLIPHKILEDLNTKKGEVFDEHDTNPDDHTINFASGNIGNVTAKHGKGEVKCRPPYIIVTQN